MTTPAAARYYLAQHEQEWEGKPFSIYNPNNRPINELPVIYGFNNTEPGRGAGFLHAVALAEDGTVLGGHGCSAEGYMPADLGMLDGSRPDRHEDDYRPHYPDGYRCVFVSSDDFDGHDGLQKAIKKAEAKAQG